MRSRVLTLLVLLAILSLALLPPTAQGQEATPTGSPSASPSLEVSPSPTDGPSQLPEVSPSPTGTPIQLPERKGAPILEPASSPVYDAKSGIWVSDSENGRIVYMKNMQGDGFYGLGFNGRGPGRFLRPEQIWVDLDGKIYVADKGNRRVIRMDDMRGFNWAEQGGLEEPVGVAVHGDRIFVSDAAADKILVYRNFPGEPVAALSDAKIRRPGYLWTDLEGNLYVAAGEDPPGGRIVRIPVNLDAPPSQWEVYEGKGLQGAGFAPGQVLTHGRSMFMTDSASERLVRIDDFNGRAARELGGLGTGAQGFARPGGLAVDEEGHLFVADTGNDRLVRMDGIGGEGFTVFDPDDVGKQLRGPRSVFVWAPRPPKPTPSPSPSPKKEDDGGWF